MKGVEPSYLAWEANVIAVILHLLIGRGDRARTYTYYVHQSPSHKILIMKLAVCNHYQQVTVFCITGASTNFATPRLYSVKELLQRYELKMTYAIPGVEKGTQSSTLSPVLGLHSRSLEQIMSNHLRRISKVKFCAEGGTRTLTPFGTTF